MSKPSVAEVRAGGQPEGIKERTNEEHWAGRLYMRDLSPYVSTVFVRLGVPPNPITYLMMACGVLAGADHVQHELTVLGAPEERAHGPGRYRVRPQLAHASTVGAEERRAPRLAV